MDPELSIYNGTPLAAPTYCTGTRGSPSFEGFIPQSRRSDRNHMLARKEHPCWGIDHHADGRLR